MIRNEDKRFRVTQTILGSGIYDFQIENSLCESYDEDAYTTVVKLLNELHEENQKMIFLLPSMKMIPASMRIRHPPMRKIPVPGPPVAGSSWPAVFHTVICQLPSSVWATGALPMP